MISPLLPTGTSKTSNSDSKSTSNLNSSLNSNSDGAHGNSRGNDKSTLTSNRISDLKTRAHLLLNTPRLGGLFAHEARERIRLVDIKPVDDYDLSGSGSRGMSEALVRLTCVAEVEIVQCK